MASLIDTRNWSLARIATRFSARLECTRIQGSAIGRLCLAVLHFGGILGANPPHNGRRSAWILALPALLEDALSGQRAEPRRDRDEPFTCEVSDLLARRLAQDAERVDDHGLEFGGACPAGANGRLVRGVGIRGARPGLGLFERVELPFSLAALPFGMVSERVTFRGRFARNQAKFAENSPEFLRQSISVP